MLTFNRRLRVVIIIALFSFTLSTASWATGPLYGYSKTAKCTHKLLRGLFNIPFCWVEIPIELNKEIRNLDPFTGTITGIGKGTYKTVKRLGFSIYEVGTFWTGNVDEYKKVTGTEFPFIDMVD